MGKGRKGSMKPNPQTQGAGLYQSVSGFVSHPALFPLSCVFFGESLNQSDPTSPFAKGRVLRIPNSPGASQTAGRHSSGNDLCFSTLVVFYSYCSGCRWAFQVSALLELTAQMKK